MDWPTGLDDARFEEAVEFFRQRLGLTKADVKSTKSGAARKGFTVAGVAQLDIVAETWRALEKALADGTTFETFKNEVGDRLRAAWAGSVANPAHRVECLPGETRVSGAVIRAVHRRWHEGDLVEVVTASGRKFSATPNHPMLARHGWVAAGQVREGDDLVSYSRKKNVSPCGYANDKDAPPSIADLFDTLSQSGVAERIATVPLDFHGDATEGDVDVVRTHGDLSVGAFAAIGQELEEVVFAPSDEPCSRFCQFCGHLVVVSQRCGFCDRPSREPAAREPAKDRAVTRAHRPSDLVCALPGAVAPGNVFCVDIRPLDRRSAATGEVSLSCGGQAATDAGGPNYAGDPAGRLSEPQCDAPHAEAREVEFDRVVSVVSRAYVGHVYNLSTPYGYFMIDGLVTGNTIFRTNVQVAYGAGRYIQATDPDIASDRPYWMYDAILDSRTTKVCRDCDGIIRAADDAWWKTHVPPLHHQCRSTFVTLTEDEAKKRGITKAPPAAKPDEGFGSPPAESDWKPERKDYPAPLWAEFQEKEKEAQR